MSSQLDLDQGGTFRQIQKIYLGPSVGWVEVPQQSVLPVTAGGTTTISRGTNLITTAFNGSLALQLPSAQATPLGPQAIPKQWALQPITIVDIGGFAGGANIYQILPFGSELISGTYNNTTNILKLSAPYGAFILTPNLTAGGWNLAQS